MPTVKDLKEEMLFNGELNSLLVVMRDISAMEFRQLQSRRERFVIFGEILKKIFAVVGSRPVKSRFVNPLNPGLCIVMITSDTGFMGGLNTQVIRAALLEPQAPEAKLITVGERGQLYLKEIGRDCLAFSSVDSTRRYDLALQLREMIVRGVNSGDFGRVVIVYPEFISLLHQKVRSVEILPVGKALEAWQEDFSLGPLIIESSLEGIVDYLAEELILQGLIEALEESKLSEFAAQTLNLDEASQRVETSGLALRLRYIHAYHEAIDSNTRTLFSSRLLLERKKTKRLRKLKSAKLKAQNTGKMGLLRARLAPSQ